MEPNSQLFRGDILQAIWSHALRLMKPITLIGVILFIITTGLSFIGMASLFGGPSEVIDMYTGNAIENQMEMQQRMLGLSSDPFQILRSFSWIILIIILIQSFVYAWLLKLSGNVLTENNDKLGAAFRLVNAKQVFGIILSGIIIGVIYFVGALIAGFLSSLVHPWTLVALVPLLILIVVRFSAVIPSIVLGGKSVLESLSYSWETITFKRALYIVLGVIVGSIVVVIVFLLVAWIAGQLGSFGIVLTLLLQLVLNILFLALGISFLTAIYYRYNDVEFQESELDKIGEE